jgi:hypothetical protein
MATCVLIGNSDMYGLGIRLGYYLQWLTTIAAAWIAPSEVPSLRLANFFFVSATLLALLVQVALGNPEAVEIYIILLFTVGGSLYLTPAYVWRFCVGMRAQWDPFRVPKAPRPSRMFSNLYSVLLLVASCFHIWFWTLGISKYSNNACDFYGFLMVKVRLDSAGLRGVHVLLATTPLASLVAISAIGLFNIRGIADREFKERTLKLTS